MQRPDRGWLSWLVVASLALARPVAADDADRVTGFVAYGTGEVSGKVTSLDGRPLAGAEVHVVSSSGVEQVITTDKAGRYHADLHRAGVYSLVFVRGDARIGGSTSVSTTDENGGEVIEMHDAAAPKVQARPRRHTTPILEYSDAAIDKNAWTRSWLLLDIDELGVVSRVKLLVRPGYDLDNIAVRAALALKFDPARDRADAPVRSLLLWSYEWPAYWWMIDGAHALTRLPAEASGVPCRGTGPSRGVYRDCTPPDVSRVFSEPWLDH